MLQLFLQKNHLRSLPAELWNLENLTVLSLRNNKLTYIPPSIARLQHLRELNLACNRLCYLPWELLTLIGGEDDLNTNGPLRSFTILPNPLFRALRITRTSAEAYVIPADNKKNMDKAQIFRESMQSTSNPAVMKEAAWFAKLHQSYANILCRQDESKPGSRVSWNTVRPMYMSSTPVVYFDIDGSPLDSNLFPVPSRIPHTNDTLLFTLPLDDSHHTVESSASRVHSLFELATSCVQNVSTLPQLQNLLPEDSPSTLFNALETATTIHEEEGERRCSVCNRSYVIPRTEWVEFWHRVPVHVLTPERLTASGLDELFLPFLRRGCSWGCVPRLRPPTL
jgi:Leucine-rich repeat (LRR) protein